MTQKKKRIVITGYGSFSHYSVNPSSEIVKNLENTYKSDDVELISELLDVAYENALTYAVKASQEFNPDFVIHLGVHPERKVLRLEQQSFSHGYCLKDVAGQVPLMNCCNVENTENSKTLTTVLDCETITNTLNGNEEIQNSGLKIMLSNDPGRFLCGYVYYCTLFLNNRKSLFVHVPDFDSTITLELLTKVVEQIIAEVLKQI
uniref:Pyroglutamyl-peptidase I n=1 Tax=Acrobeloides nanus TaxID=290746 RepID=A0A914C041_9BILA